MKLETFFDKFDPFADAPDAVAKMQSAGSAGLRTRRSAGLRTRRSAGLRTRLVSDDAPASAEPRVPSAERAAPGGEDWQAGL
jgi:hypothetical protein